MKRRTFLKYLAVSMIGVSCPFLWDIRSASAAQAFPKEPMIYKRFFQFSEYVECPSIEDIVIHHSGFPDGRDSTAEEIHRMHKKLNGWAGIGYHYFIRKDGMIEQGRVPGYVGAHAEQHNQTSIGICLSGNFNFQEPTKAQMKSVKELVAWLCAKYELDPEKKNVIIGHRDVCDTSCPGKNLYSRLDEIRRAA